jgi:hypothetical protein
MRCASVALGIALAGCGRFGFQAATGPGDGGDDDTGGIGGPGGNAITLRVVSDETMAQPAGQPIAGATVVVERDGAVERLATDAQGIARFAAAGVVACHVALRSELGWRIYTVGEPHGTIELGGRRAFNLDHSMTIHVPDDGSSDFTVHVSEHCAFPPFSGPEVTFSYNPDCEGKPTRAIVYGRSAGGRDVFFDAGPITLADGAMRTVTGNYVPVPPASVAVSNLELGFIDAVGFEIFARTGVDLVPLTIDFPSTTPTGTTTTVSGIAAPGGNALEIQLTAALPIQYSSTSVRIVPLSTAAPMLDARTLVPVFRSLVLTRPPEVSWTGSGTGGTILTVETLTGHVQWDAYLPPSATKVRFPDLPADLGVPVPASFDFASVVKLEIPGATTADLLPTIDRTSSQWPHDPALLPAEGSARATILYTVGLGPP